MARPLKDYTQVGTIMSDWIFGNVSFVFFLFFVCLIYIANSNYADKQVRQIQALEKDIKDLKWRYNGAKADVMLSTKQSEIEKRVEPYGLRASNQRTKRIVVE
jgi:Bacteriodetes cell division protein (FtsL-like)